ncbi:Peptide methionine sulfoxide reductase B3 [Golovinomyces cichoracearum]|uniref:Peptide-methionine (R)-S-oxide reductase n=1 Tax=Golovinomyces cichoracearum TaxID=62708 RepID=A0A420J2P5_9PEZI|nr:Peptide methionine sulfoxide reductase B3 [Golovinomyces cichoracearum]
MRPPNFPKLSTFLINCTNTRYSLLERRQILHFPTQRRALKSMTAFQFLSSFLSSNSSSSMSYPVQKSEEEWQAILSKEQFRVLRKQGTEAPFTGQFDQHMPDEGVYSCAGCDAPLYRASHKFKSGCGWPAYFDNIPGAVTRHTDYSLGMPRIEIVCSNCGGHLGHVFKGEGYKTPTNERHCVNSISMNFSPNDPFIMKDCKARD